jgi:hypothetical protein
MAAVGYQINEGGQYGWPCYGPQAYAFSSVNEETQTDFSVVFDLVTKQMYEVTVSRLKEDDRVAYRWIDPNFVDIHRQEVELRKVDDGVCEGLPWVELEVFQDWVEKATAIRDGKPYDKRIMIQIELDDKTFSGLARLAHEADMTFNQYVEKILRDEINRLAGATSSH